MVIKILYFDLEGLLLQESIASGKNICFPLDLVVKLDYNNVVMELFRLTNSKTREKILRLYANNPDQDYYLHQLARKLGFSAANIRRELISLLKLGLFTKDQKGRFSYYRINTDSPLYQGLGELLFNKGSHPLPNISRAGLFWTTASSPRAIPENWYCQTRDKFSARLETVLLQLEKKQGNDAYLLTAVAGEIGHNSFDHNLGSWPDLPGIFFALDLDKKTIVLADRGQGILKTIKRVMPKIVNDRLALNIAFTKIISGRKGEKRGNGLKFVSRIIKEKNWRLYFSSGNASLTIKSGKFVINKQPLKNRVNGCLAVLKY